ncbi:hypothetical protein DC522_26560 [Microvirga sp. KLBC 81]|uniref:DUF2059 domain-containing protein n=1 Tax=Microvirga sp. KLBC 81 TaxID=1862707 RepID=UPI000D51B4C7|nr:DUF2059 domain-containing protein [Microvirga sp. KLBC 81]PVE21430.1 hypothetical protein DC522_26560 [Microvirga sp. KLBC 81]
MDPTRREWVQVCGQGDNPMVHYHTCHSENPAESLTLELARWLGLWGVLGLPLAAQAQPVTYIDEKINYIFDVPELKQGLDIGYHVMKPKLLNQIQKSSNKISPEISDYISRLIDDEFVQIKPAMLTFIKDYYKRQFTEEEIGALYDFYRTPVGSRLASKLNTVSAGLLPEMQTFMGRQFAPRLHARLSSDARLRDAFKP